MTVTFLQAIIYHTLWAGRVRWARIALDLCSMRFDNQESQANAQAIYSPSDMPQGLRRGSAFQGEQRGRVIRAR